MDSICLELKDVSKYYVSGRNVTAALKGVSLAFHKGEFVAITGESGSGKTTMANILGGILPFENGELIWQEQPTLQYNEEDWENYRRDNVSFIAQNYGILPGNSVLDNVLSALKLAGWEMKPAKVEAKKLLQKVELWKKRRRRAARLSSGQKQRLAIARALAKGAPVILADEPTGNLDPKNSKMVIELLAEAAKDRLVIMITHDFKMAQDHVTRRVSIHDGRVRGDVVLREDYSEVASESALPDEAGKTADSAAEITVDSGQKRLNKKNRGENGKRVEHGKIGKTQKPGSLLGWYIARLQMRARPAWTGFMALFFALTAFAVFAFLGTFIVSLDDTSTRIYDYSAFRNGDQERLVLKKSDGTEFAEEDYERIFQVSWISEIQRFDAVQDVNYYYQRDIDYDLRYWLDSGLGKEDEMHEDVIFLSDTNFIQTVPVLREGEEFLTAGKLPEHMSEVVAVGDESLIGTTISVHMLDNKKWGVSNYITYEMTVVGVTDRGEGLYFDDRVGQMFYRSINRDGWLIGVDPELTGEMVLVCENLNPFLPSPLTGMADLNHPDETVILQYAGYHDSKNSNYAITSEEVFDRIAYQGGYTQISAYLADYSYTDRAISALGGLGYVAVSPYRVSSVEVDAEKSAERMTTLVICMLALVVSVAAQVAVLSAMFGLEMKNYAQLSDLGLSCRTGKLSVLWQVLLLTVIGQLATAGLVYAAVTNLQAFAPKTGLLDDVLSSNPAISFRPDSSNLNIKPTGTGVLDTLGDTARGWIYDGIMKLHDIVKYLEPIHIAAICALHLAASLLVVLAVCRNLRKQVFPYIQTNTDVDLIELETEEVAE